VLLTRSAGLGYNDLYAKEKVCSGKIVAPLLSVLLMANNYCHDIATAMLMATGVTMWVVVRRLEGAKSPEALSLLFSLYGGISKVVTFSLIWVSAGAVVRILAFPAFEFAEAQAGGRLPGLMTRHIISSAMTIGGACLWISLIRRIKEIRSRAYINV
jgi:hypothetical protein